jgi:hypothetical protein
VCAAATLAVAADTSSAHDVDSNSFHTERRTHRLNVKDERMEPMM